MRHSVVAAGLVAAVVGLTGCSGSSGSSGGDNPSLDQLSPGSSPSATTAVANGTCQKPPATAPKREHFSTEPKLTIARTTYTARIVTNCGTIVVALDGKHAPHTVNSFVFLARHHYFDHTNCHRLTTAGIFVLQCGDPTGTGSGGPGYTLPDENLKGATYPAGTVAMANAGPNTGGSQFFFVYADSQLDPNYTPFGRVVQGLDVLKAIAKNGTSTRTSDGPPAQLVVIESFTVRKG